MNDYQHNDIDLPSIKGLIQQRDVYISEDTAKTISNFCLLWNLYEGIFFNKKYSNKALLLILENKNPSIRIVNIEQPLDYFRRRYIERQYEFNEKYRRLDPNKLSKADHTLKLENGLNDYTNRTNPEFTILAIIFRLRNNLFHGEKSIHSLNEQRINFVVANNVLYEIISNYNSKSSNYNHH